LKHSVPKSSALPDTGNFRRQEVFAFTLKGTSTDKMGKIKNTLCPTQLQLFTETLEYLPKQIKNQETI